MKPHRPYQLKEYDPQWKEQFIRAAEQIKPILGDNLIELEHVGSTSIEGMVAKPQVDILAVVRDLNLVEKCRQELLEAGFKPLGIGYVSENDFTVVKDASDGTRLITIHTLQEGNPKIQDYKIFRDYLKVNKEDRELYIATKRGLYEQYSESYAEYDGGKTDIIEAIKARAREWASK